MSQNLSLFTHPSTCTISWFVLINVSRALFSVPLVIVSTRLSCLLIYYISISSLCLYNYLIAIMLIISLFFLVVLSLTRHLYSEYKLVFLFVSIILYLI